MLQLSNDPPSFRGRVERNAVFFTAAMWSNGKKSIHNHVLCTWRGLYNTPRISTALTGKGSLGHNTAQHEWLLAPRHTAKLNEQGDLAVMFSGGARLESRPGHRLSSLRSHRALPQSLTASTLYSRRLWRFKEHSGMHGFLDFVHFGNRSIFRNIMFCTKPEHGESPKIQ
jgi:hypothetical protein